MFRKLFCLLAMNLALAATIGRAHPGHNHDEQSATRLWRHVNGFELRASFLRLKELEVQLQKRDGSLISVPLPNLCREDQAWIRERLQKIERLNTPRALGPLEEIDLALNDESPSAKPAVPKNLPAEVRSLFAAFAPFQDKLKLRWDDRYFFVESNGLPDHPMMKGIRNWQQQVPLPQPYTGDNAWRIPLHPVEAKTPASAKNRFLRGAIALAVNGVPIFNPLNNRGEDSFAIGELDEWGGHCGRADDYHYHIAPVHLEKIVGKGQPIAYALDGYPIFGEEEPDGSKVKSLDALNGHKDEHGRYHYHATKTYPYLNGGFHGEVTERGGQVDPQPRSEPIHPDGRPIRGAKITDFQSLKPGSYRLTYEVGREQRLIDYHIASDGSVDFQFTDGSGKTTTETYRPRRRRQ